MYLNTVIAILTNSYYQKACEEKKVEIEFIENMKKLLTSLNKCQIKKIVLQ